MKIILKIAIKSIIILSGLFLIIKLNFIGAEKMSLSREELQKISDTHYKEYEMFLKNNIIKKSTQCGFTETFLKQVEGIKSPKKTFIYKIKSFFKGASK